MPETLREYSAEPYSYAEARVLVEELGVSEPIAATLVRRGYRTPDAAKAFLAADESHPPSSFASMPIIVERVLAAVEEGRRITVHGDFDVDGVCATAIAVSTLRELGADCDWLIPDRLVDGYGLSGPGIERLAERGTSLLLTVDCGVTAVEEVAKAASLGMEVVVTDHHEAGEELPACPVLHPTLDGYPFEQLCGTAVAWKLALALREASGGGAALPAEVVERDLDLVALATIADVVPLIGENRALVRRGLVEMRRGARLGLRALMTNSGCEPDRIDETDLSFRLAPRINAAGRLYRADAGVELMLCEEEGRAKEIAAELSRANGERRKTEREVANAAEAALRALPPELGEAPGWVVAGEGWHPGVIGIVASRLVESHNRPVVVVGLGEDGEGRGSGRSIPGFDLHAALSACSEHLVRFGGHRMAAGLSLRREQLGEFQAAFAAYVKEALGDEEPRRVERVDAMVGGASLSLDLAEELRRLAPFGMGNPGVKLLVPGAQLSDVRSMGEGKHSRFNLHSGSHRAVGVAFGKPSLGVEVGDRVDATVRLEVNHWNGSVEPRLVLRELYPVLDPPDEAEDDAWWERFEVERARTADAVAAPVDPPADQRRVRVSSLNAPAAVLAELASAGGSVLALVAEAGPRAAMAGGGVRLADYLELERDPSLPASFDHAVLVDPPPAADLEALCAAGPSGSYLHLVWGEAEWRFAGNVLGAHLAQRAALAELFRDIREAGEGGAPLATLRGEGRRRRAPEAVARGLRVLAELGLVVGEPSRDGGAVEVVSSEGTELERSPAFMAYRTRYEECRQYLARRRQP